VELSWSTFVLEIINFLVLVWILKRFFYKPVLDVIARRRAGIEKSLADARETKSEAEKLQEQYQNRLADWDKEKQQARENLMQEIEAERSRKMAELKNDLEQEREKAHVIEQRRQIDAERKAEEAALTLSARFATRLLQQAAGPELETRLVELALSELTTLSDEQITALRASYGQAPEPAVVVSAFPLTDEHRDKLKQAIATLTDQDMPVQFEQDSELLAGLRIMLGNWVLGVNLQDELKGFATMAQGQSH
jgi:F-type H+-transporting ATPase subunit b